MHIYIEHTDIFCKQNHKFIYQKTLLWSHANFYKCHEVALRSIKCTYNSNVPSAVDIGHKNFGTPGTQYKYDFGDPSINLKWDPIGACV